MEGFEQLDETGARLGDRLLVADHLHEPSLPVGGQQSSEHALLGPGALARKVVKGHGAHLRLYFLAHVLAPSLVDRAQADLAAPTIDVAELAAAGAGKHDDA